MTFNLAAAPTGGAILATGILLALANSATGQGDPPPENLFLKVFFGYDNSFKDGLGDRAEETVKEILEKANTKLSLLFNPEHNIFIQPAIKHIDRRASSSYVPVPVTKHFYNAFIVLRYNKDEDESVILRGSNKGCERINSYKSREERLSLVQHGESTDTSANRVAYALARGLGIPYDTKSCVSRSNFMSGNGDAQKWSSCSKTASGNIEFVRNKECHVYSADNQVPVCVVHGVELRGTVSKTNSRVFGDREGEFQKQLFGLHCGTLCDGARHKKGPKKCAGYQLLNTESKRKMTCSLYSSLESTVMTPAAIDTFAAGMPGSCEEFHTRLNSSQYKIEMRAPVCFEKKAYVYGYDRIGAATIQPDEKLEPLTCQNKCLKKNGCTDVAFDFSYSILDFEIVIGSICDFYKKNSASRKAQHIFGNWFGPADCKSKGTRNVDFRFEG